MAEPTIKIFEGKTIESIDQDIEIDEEIYIIKFTDGNILKINSYSDSTGASGLAWEIDSY
tara:strand:+ start:1391 stop:1570 length:180 start_codon:yes stop_codon:yes gene_type:complete